MLQYSTVESHTLDVLKELMQMPEMNDFYLAGGTALALYYGHRLSEDIDLMGNRQWGIGEYIKVPDANCTAIRCLIFLFNFTVNVGNFICAGFPSGTTVKSDLESKAVIKEEQAISNFG